MLQGPHLGSDGEGQSARYRLTDRYFHGKPPTRDFDRWSGEVFRPTQRAYSEAEKTRLNGLKKQNPVTRSVTPRNTVDNVRAKAKRTQKGNNRNTADNVSEEPKCNTADNVSSITTRAEFSGCKCRIRLAFDASRSQFQSNPLLALREGCLSSGDEQAL